MEKQQIFQLFILIISYSAFSLINLLLKGNQVLWFIHSNLLFKKQSCNQVKINRTIKNSATGLTPNE